jgi:hypothetical protein
VSADTTPPATRSPRARLWRIAQVTLLAIVAYGLYRSVAGAIEGVGLPELLRWRPEPLRLLLSTVLLLGVYLAHAALWRKIMHDLDIARPSARTALRVYFLASLGRYIPGRLWQLAGMAVLAQRAGMPPLQAAAAAVIGQIGFLSTGLLFLAAMLPGYGGGGRVWIGAGLLLATAIAGWCALVAGWARPLRDRARRRLGEGRGARRLDAALGLADGVAPRHAVYWAAMYAASWLLLGTAFAVFASAFVPLGAGAGRHLAGTIAASYLAGYLAIFAPAGLIVRELAMLTLLTEIMPGPAALMVAIASRLWFTLAELLPLALVPVLRRGEEDA